jgi:hypothetical protein
MAAVASDQAIVLNGFTQLSRALRRVEGGPGNFGLGYELQRRLRTVGETVAKAAPGFITHRTGRGSGELEGSVKVSVTTRSASVYSTSVYGGIQNFGGGPHGGWAARGPHIRKANASHWMDRAVNSQTAFVAKELDGLIDWLIDEFEAG